jgi:hypothetical protein
VYKVTFRKRAKAFRKGQALAPGPNSRSELRFGGTGKVAATIKSTGHRDACSLTTLGRSDLGESGSEHTLRKVVVPSAYAKEERRLGGRDCPCSNDCANVTVDMVRQARRMTRTKSRPCLNGDGHLVGDLRGFAGWTSLPEERT